MKYLVDTDIIINHLRGKQFIKPQMVKSGLAISIITLGELLYGAHKCSQTSAALRTVKSFIKDLNIKTLTLDQKTINNYAVVKARLEKEGQRLDEFDLLIGATAKVNDLYLLTNNIKHFERFPNLKIAS